jgi:IclR family mhp operon transcriptional activator
MRALSVLHAVNLPEMSSLDDITRATGLPKPTVVRLLETLAAAGYVKKEGRAYRVTSRVIQLSAGYQTEAMVSEAGSSIINEVTHRERWPLALAVLKDDTAVVCASTLRVAPLATGYSTGRRGLSLVSHALGRAYLAFCATDECNRLLDRLSHSPDPADALAQHREQAQALIRRIRNDGFAERDPMIQPQATSTIAVPVPLRDSVVATLGLTYFPSAIDRAELYRRYLPLLQGAAARIGERIETLQAAWKDGLQANSVARS